MAITSLTLCAKENAVSIPRSEDAQKNVISNKSSDVGIRFQDLNRLSQQAVTMALWTYGSMEFSPSVKVSWRIKVERRFEAFHGKISAVSTKGRIALRRSFSACVVITNLQRNHCAKESSEHDHIAIVWSMQMAFTARCRGAGIHRLLSEKESVKNFMLSSC